MPQLGESIAEGTIVKWLKAPGDAVEKDENVVIISTDKVEAEIPAPSSGVLLDILVEPGETVDIGTVLAHVGEAGETPAQAPKKEKEESHEPVKPDPKPSAAPEIPKQAPAIKPLPISTPPMAAHSSQARFYSPLVKNIAKEHDVSETELDQIQGSGNNGRVTKKDLLAYLPNRRPVSALKPQQIHSSAPKVPDHGIVFESGQAETIRPISTMRRVIMENMVASKQKSAHVTTFFEIDYTNIDKVRNKDKDAFKLEEGVSLTYTTFLTAALSQCLRRHPYINAEVRDGSIVFKKEVHLGVAVAIEQPEPGLMVPVIKNADRMNLRGLAHAINDLAIRTRNKKIRPDELGGGTFTLTNPGNFGAVIGTPIINQPQVAILGVGKIAKTPVALEVNGVDVVGVKRMGWLSLSFDHRLIDGATADIFMADLKHTLENWNTRP